VFAEDNDTKSRSLAYGVESMGSSCNISAFNFKNNHPNIITVNGADAEEYRQTQGRCTLNITVTDHFGLSNWTIVNITIIDENEYYPTIIPVDNVVTINDNTNVLSVILNVSATDSDLTEGQCLFFLHDSSGMFYIDELTGLVHLKQTVQNAEPKYNITVVVVDSGSPPLESNKTYIINVTDVNEKPQLDPISSPIYVQQFSSAGLFLFAAKATDPDRDVQNKNLTFSISQNGNLSIAIDPMSGNVSLTGEAKSSGNFTYQITVTDGGGLNDVMNVTVIVPNIKKETVNVTVLENSVGTIYKFSFTKVEQYTLEPSFDSSRCSIDNQVRNYLSFELLIQLKNLAL